MKLSALPIRYRLPILICGLLLVFAGVSSWAAYREVRRSEMAGARDRLSSVTEKMADMLRTSAATMRSQMYVPAHRSYVTGYLTSNNTESETTTQHIIDSLSKSPLVAGIEIWGPDATPLLASAGDVPQTSAEAAREMVSRLSPSDTAVIGPYRQHMDSAQQSRVHYTLVAPVRDASGVTGYFVLHRRLNSSSQEMKRIRDLIGSDVGLFVGTPESNLWTDWSAQVAPPPVSITGTDSLMEYRREGLGLQLASSASVAGTPWVALLEFPSAPILEGTRRVTQNLAMIWAALLVIGGVGAWGMTLLITRPLERLATGADAIARGDYSLRVDSSRGDELGALGRAFNAMAQSVGTSVDQLANDISERKRAQEALREADEQLRAMVEASPLATISLDAEGRIKLWNQAAVRVFGWNASEVMGQMLPTVTDEQRAEHASLRARAMNGEVIMGLEVSRKKRDGGSLHLRLSCAATYDTQGKPTGITAIFEDITSSRKLEEQFRQAQKMEAVGRLAGGIAHDFNNLLTVVLGASDMLLHDLPEDDEYRGVVSEIKQAGERAAALTTQLLAFSRKQLVEPKVFIINQLVADIDKMMRRLIGEDVQMTVRLDPELGAVEADRGHVEQVLVNLAVNARDSMPQGGALVIETANVRLDEDYARSHSGVSAGDYVMLAVSDTGAGMSDETKLHLFEPFFTTKSAGKGTGLGLATCYGIVQQSGGHIGVYSEPGVGTTMRVYLPRVADVGTSRPATQEVAARGSETILLVEDDAAVRSITRRMLDAQGYAVIEAPDGPTALKLLDSYPGRVDLLFTDVVLPGMGGRIVAEEARALRPGIRVLFASGYTDDVILQHKLLEHDVSLLQKPFTTESLAKKVRAVLDSTPED